MNRGSVCRLCGDDFGIGVHFGSSFVCRTCEEDMWEFLRKALQAMKTKQKK